LWGRRFRLSTSAAESVLQIGSQSDDGHSAKPASGMDRRKRLSRNNTVVPGEDQCHEVRRKRLPHKVSMPQ